MSELKIILPKTSGKILHIHTSMKSVLMSYDPHRRLFVSIFSDIHIAYKIFLLVFGKSDFRMNIRVIPNGKSWCQINF